MSQKPREIFVFAALFALPFAGAFVVEWWAATLLCPLAVIGLVGLNEGLGEIRWVRPLERDGGCAGADLKAFAGGQRRRRTEDGDGPMGPTRMILGKPVIAAVEGYAVAGGLELALWCDLRVAAEDAVFGVFCRRWGVPLIDLGTVRLPRLIGQSHAMDLILTGRGVSGDEALRMGLANRIVPKGQALVEAVTLANDLAALPQRCLRSDRMSALEQWSLGSREAMLNEFHRGMTVVNSGESKEGATRFAAGAGRHGAKG